MSGRSHAVSGGAGPPAAPGGGPNPAEVVICGAGMAGIAAAHELACRSKQSRVVLIDEREPLTLTSSKGTEAYRNWWPGPGDTMVRFMNRSVDLLDELAASFDFELNRRGYVFLTAEPQESEQLRAQGQAIAALGAESDFSTDRELIRRRFPFVAEQTCAMLHVRRAGWMNARKLGLGLLERAVEKGVQVLRDRVEELVVEGGRVRAVRLASGARIETRAFVLSAGPLLAEWAARLELPVEIKNELHGKIAFEDDLGIVPRDAPLMIWNDVVNIPGLGRYPPGVHFRPRGERTLLGIWTYDAKVEEPVFPPRFDPQYSSILIRGLAGMIPGLKAYERRAHEALVDGGYYCKTPDNRPLIGPWRTEGAYLLGALSGFGVMASQAAAELLARHVMHETPPDYAPFFAPSRFEDPAYQKLLSELGPSSGQL